MPFDLDALRHLVVALVGGLAVGIEREWSGHAAGPRARFAGIRTFTLLGLVAGLSGWFWIAGLRGPALVFLAGLGALVVVAYFAASRHDVDGTTEVAAFVVMAAGVLAGAGYDAAASGIVAVTLLLLVEKKRLHGIVTKMDRAEIRAGARFAVMAAVILPLLPSGPLGGVRPRTLWALVLFFSGLSFVGYVLRRTVGVNRGYAIAGTLGGLVSSTSTTLTLARVSRDHPETAQALASGVMGANLMLFPRVLVSSAVLAPAMALALWPAFVPPAIVAGVLMLRSLGHPQKRVRAPQHDNPLQIWSALQMALLFQVVLFAMAFAKGHFGQSGVFASAAAIGLAEMDALTISMAHLTTQGTAALVTSQAVVIGVLANTLTKFVIAVVIGRGRFRVLAGTGLLVMGAALASALLWRY